MGTTENELQSGAIDYVALRKQALAAEQKPETQPAIVGGAIDYRALRQQALASEASPAEPTNGIADMVNDYVSPAVSDLGKHLEKGDLHVARSFALAGALARGVAANDDGGVDQVLAEYKAKEKTKGLDKPDFTPFGRVLGPMAEMVGPIKGVLGSAAGGALAGAPGGAAGIAFMSSGAVFLGTATSSAGDLYGTFIEQGIPNEQAKALATVGGAVMGKLGMLSWNVAGKPAQQAFVNYLTGAGKPVFKDAVKGYLGFAATQGLLGGANKLTEQVLGTVGKAVGRHDLPTMNDFGKGVVDLLAATATSTAVGAVVGPASHVTGALAGRAFKAALQFRKAPTMGNAAELVDAVVHPNEHKPLESRISYSEPEPIALPEKTSQARLSEKKATVKKDLQEQTKRRETAEQEIEALKARIDQIEGDYELAIDTQNYFKKQAAAVPVDEAKLAELKFKLETAQSDLKVAKKEAADLKAETADMIDKTRRQVIRLQGRVASTTEAITEAKQTLETLKGQPQKGKSAQEKANHAKSKKDAQARIDSLNEKLTNLGKELKKAEKEQTTTTTSAQKTEQAKLNKLNARIAKLQTTITAAQDETESALATKRAADTHATNLTKLRKDKAEEAGKFKFKLQLAQEEKTAAAEAEADLQKKFNEMDRADRKIAKVRLAAAVEATKPQGTGTNAESKFRGEDVQKILDYFRLFITDNNAREEAVSDFHRAIATGEPTHEQIVAHEVAKEVGDLKTKTPEEINKIARTMEGIISEGKSNRALELMYEKEQQDKLNADLAAAINGQRGGAAAPVEDLGNPHADPRSSRTTISRVGDFVRQYGHAFFNWDGKWDIAAQDVPPEQRKILIGKLSWAESVKNHIADRRAWADTYFNYLKEETNNAGPGGTWRLLKAIAEGGIKRKTIHYIDANGKDASVTMTYMEMAHTLMMMNDSTLERGLREGNKYTFGGQGKVTTPEIKALKGQIEILDNKIERISNGIDQGDPTDYRIKRHELKDKLDALENVKILTTQAAIEGALPEVYKQIATASTKFYHEFGGYFARAYERDKGLALIINPGYSGPAQRVAHQGETNAAQWELELNEYKPTVKTTATPGATIVRVDSPLALKSKNIFNLTGSHIENITGYATKRAHSKVVSRVLANPFIKAGMDVKFPGLHAQLEAHNTDIVSGQSERITIWQAGLDHLTNGIVIDNLGLKPDQPLKQLSGMINGLLEMPVGEFSAGLSEFWTDPVKNSKAILSSPAIRARYGGYLDIAAGVASERSQGVFSLAIQGSREAALTPMKLGDYGSSLQTGYAMYRWKYNTAPEHFTDLQKHQFALAAAEEVIENTQASGRIDQLSEPGRRWYLKPFFVMQQPTLRQFQYETTAWRDALNHPTRENYLKAIKTSFVLGASNFAFKAAAAAYQQFLVNVGAAKQEDVDNAMWRAYRGFVLREDMPVIGGMVDAQLLQMQKDAGADTTEKAYMNGAVSFTVAETAINTQRLHSKVKTAVEDGVITHEEFWDIMYAFARSAYNRAVIQQPLSGPTKIMKGASEDDDETVLEIGDQQ